MKRDATRTAPARLAELGIARVPLPTPFLVGDINVYLIEDDPLTLVDCGPNTGTALGALESGLTELGHRLTDVQLVLVTHQHCDHLGLAAEIAARAGASIACLDLLAAVMEEWDVHERATADHWRELMVRHGVSPAVAAALRTELEMERGWGAPAAVEVRLADGGAIALRDRTLRVHHRPGHSPSDTLFVDDARGVALGGDHLLADISSNAIVSLPLPLSDGAVTPRQRPLLEYRTSLRATRDQGLELMLPGHRAPIRDPGALIDQRLAEQELRAEAMRELLGREPRAAYEVAEALFGELAVEQPFFTLSEVLGHLDLMVQRGAVAEQAGPELTRFVAI